MIFGDRGPPRRVVPVWFLENEQLLPRSEEDGNFETSISSRDHAGVHLRRVR